MRRAHAEAVVGWQYPDYPLFNTSPEQTEFEVRVLLEPAYHYYVALNGQEETVGFCCFGEDARVPGGNYAATDAIDVDVLDVGLGLHPSLVGRGLGLPFLEAILVFGIDRYAPARFRATIAVFNVRSRRIFERAGFRLCATFESAHVRSLQFVILEKTVDPT